MINKVIVFFFKDFKLANTQLEREVYSFTEVQRYEASFTLIAKPTHKFVASAYN